MIAIKARFDGHKIAIPDQMRGHPPGDVIIVLEDGFPEDAEEDLWMRAQQAAFSAVWDNDEDADASNASKGVRMIF